MQIAMIEDKIVPTEELSPTYLDRGLYFGDGVYEALRSYNGKILAFDEHLQRFSSSLAAVKITGVDIDRIRRRVQKAFDAAAIPNALIYFHITRGSTIRNHIWEPGLKPNFFLTITELPDSPPRKTKGIAVSTYPDLRWKKCNIKSLNLLPNVLAINDAAAKGCEEAILVNEAGLITEGSLSAFFAISDQKLQTAPLTSNILPSITRGFVIQLAKDVGLELIEKSLTPQKAADADELFVAGTTFDIVPVVKFDDKTIGNGTPGEYTKLLINRFISFTV